MKRASLIFAASVMLGSLVPAPAETPLENFTRVMAPLAGRWSCAGVDDVTGRNFRRTEYNAVELRGRWFRSHEVEAGGRSNDVITSTTEPIKRNAFG